jgi:hypothetical protein
MLVLKFFKEQWLGSAMIILFTIYMFHSQSTSAKLINETKRLEIIINDLNKKDHAYAKTIDSLSKIDTIIVNRIKIIKQKEYVQIRIIDSLPVSGLQKYFTDRYEEK